MRIQNSRSTRIAVIISLVIHVIAFLILAWVKLYTNEDAKDSGISVTFVQELRAKVMRRSLQARPALMSKPPQRHPSGQQVAASLTNRVSSDSYIIDASAEVFSDVWDLDHMVVQGGGMQRPSANFRQSMVKPIATELRESNPLSPQVQIGSSIHNRFADDSHTLAEPEMRIAADNNNDLQEFFDTIRKRIESRKKFPESARHAGFEGRSGVRITILKNGQLGNVEVVDSSGREILDNAALQSVRDAAPFPPIPVGSGHERIRLRIYLVFKLSQP